MYPKRRRDAVVYEAKMRYATRPRGATDVKFVIVIRIKSAICHRLQYALRMKESDPAVYIEGYDMHQKKRGRALLGQEGDLH